MSIIHGQMLLEEDCDEKYEITEKEIEEYATIIGIDPEKEPDLLWIAREGATVPLPPDWRPCKDLDSGDIYYFNTATNETTWDHPCDEFYKNMVIEERHKQMLGLSTATMKKKNDKKRKTKEEKNMKDKSQIVNPLSPSRQSLAPINLNPSTPLSLLKPGVLSPIRTSSASMTKDQLISTNTDRVINSIMGSMTSGPSRDNVVVSKKIVIQNPLKPKSLDTVTSPFLKSALREENIQLLSDMSDDLIPSREAGDDVRAAGSLEYEESDVSDHEEGGSMLQYHLSDEEEEEEEFELQGDLAEKLNAMDISQILAAYDYEKKSPVTRLPKESQDVKRSFSSQNRSGSAKSMEEQLLLLEEHSSRDLAIFEEKVAEELDEAKQELEQEKIMKLEQARQEMEKFLEEEKKRLSEDRSKQIKNFEDQIMKEIKEEEKKLLEKKNKDIKEMKEKIEKERKDKEQLFKDELEKALSNIKSEAEKVKADEEMKIEKEKAIALQKLKKEVEISVTKHKEDLDKQAKTRIEQFKKQLEERHQEAIMELETSFATQKESFTKELEEKHNKELQSITAELEKLRDEEKCRKESEIKILKEKQKTIEDLERGLQTILMEKRKEAQEQQHKELNALHSEHNRTIVKLKQEFKDKELEESKLMIENFALTRKKMEQQQDLELGEIKRKFENRMKYLLIEQEEEEIQIKKKQESLSSRKKKFEKDCIQSEKEEQELNIKKEYFAKEESQLNENLVKLKRDSEQLKDECTKLKETLQSEKKAVYEMKNEKMDLDDELKKLRRRRELYSRKIRELSETYTEAKNVVNKTLRTHPLTDNPPITVSKPSIAISSESLDNQSHENQGSGDVAITTNQHECKIPSPENPNLSESRLRRRRQSQNNNISDQSDSKLISHRHSFQFHSWDEVSVSDSAVSEVVPKPRQRSRDTIFRSQEDIQKLIKKENESIIRAHQFLKNHKAVLKQRQIALKAAQQELSNDIANITTTKAGLIDDIKLHLDQEAVELDRFETNMRTGKRLLKEKEKKLQTLESSFELSNESSSSSDEFSIGKTELHRTALKLQDMTVDSMFDSEHSSGVGSDINENFCDLKKSTISIPTKKNTSNVMENFQDDSTSSITQSLHHINGELSRVLNILSSQNQTDFPSTSYPSLFVPSGLPSNIVPYQPAHLQSHYTTVHPHSPVAWKADHYYSNYRPKPSNTFYQQSQISAEEVLYRKWRSYFGDMKAPLPVSVPPSSNLYNSSLIRDQVKSMTEHRYARSEPEYNTAERLAEHRKWLKSFETGLNISLSAANKRISESNLLNDVTDPFKMSNNWMTLNNSLPLRYFNR